MYCSIDKVDLAASVEGHEVAIQTDHRSAAEIDEEPELSGLFAMARVLNARGLLADEGHPEAAVCYVISGDAPLVLREALRAAGGTLERVGAASPVIRAEPVALDEVAALADRWFAALARRTAGRVGTRDLGMALRMLEDQTLADPPAREDEPRYWARVLELAALTGELLRAKHPSGRWETTRRATVPFGFQLGDRSVVFPTNRAQRVIEDGADESLFKLLLAAEESLRLSPEAGGGRVMPSLRAPDAVELDEAMWSPLFEDAPDGLPVIVYGLDGENTFMMLRDESSGRPLDELRRDALANLATEDVELELVRAGDLTLAVVSGSFYAAEKLLDPALMQRIARELDAELLAVAMPARGVLLATSAMQPGLAELVLLVADRYADAGGRAISPAVLLVADGDIVGFVDGSVPTEDEDAGGDDDLAAAPDSAARRAGILRRLLGRK
ncbi:MAG: hypothetical protein KF773_08335 [Deltaproteobacteria bacterium]|nr:hypothetical protein [Deltaproteobacteria bacterium]MCW5805971.1 hypothetical protein [Deltaproteobacteria bacterium]